MKTLFYLSFMFLFANGSYAIDGNLIPPSHCMETIFRGTATWNYDQGQQNEKFVELILTRASIQGLVHWTCTKDQPMIISLGEWEASVPGSSTPWDFGSVWGFPTELENGDLVSVCATDGPVAIGSYNNNEIHLAIDTIKNHFPTEEAELTQAKLSVVPTQDEGKYEFRYEYYVGVNPYHQPYGWNIVTGELTKVSEQAIDTCDVK